MNKTTKYYTLKTFDGNEFLKLNNDGTGVHIAQKYTSQELVGVYNINSTYTPRLDMMQEISEMQFKEAYFNAMVHLGLVECIAMFYKEIEKMTTDTIKTQYK